MRDTLLLAYMTAGLWFWTYSMYRLLVADRRRWKGLQAVDLFLLGGVALLSSAAWPMLLPVYAIGWLRSGEGHRALERVRGLAHPSGRPGALHLKPR